jgi:4-amino-4-deoxy-L-arabinose transferase-like glycosyltransferase
LLSAEGSPASTPRLGARAATLLFLLALTVRLAATAVVGFSTLGFGDARIYLFAARTLAQTGQYPHRTDPPLFRPPGYPAFLVVSTLGQPDRVALAKVANSIVGSLTALLLAWLSARIFRRRALAIATGVAAAVHPTFWLMATEIQSEPLFLFFFLSAGLLLLIGADRPSSNAALLAGVALGLAALTRSTALALAPFLLAPLADRRYPVRARGHLAASAVLGLVLALAPWTIRNAMVFHELLPVNDAGGASLYWGNSRLAARYYRIRTRAEYEQWSLDIDADMRARLAEMERAGPLSPGRRSALFARAAIEDARSDPKRALWLFGQKAWQWLRPYPSPWYWPLSIVFTVGVLYSALDLLGAIGLATSPRRGVALFCVLLLAVTMAAHVVLQVVWRYRAPYWDPVLILYSVFAADRLLRRRIPDKLAGR